MGDPHKQRKKYVRPTHLWRLSRIEEENELINKYGLKNKREIWQARAAIARVRHEAIQLLARSGEEAEKERTELVERLMKTGLIKSNALEAILALTVEDMLERRLQTIVYRKGIAHTPKQARQLIVHGQIIVGKNAVSVPKYPVKPSEENSIRLKEGVKLPVSGKKEIAVGPAPEGETSIEGVSVGKEV
jgi:small subunit ribosomal protein S4